MVRQLNIRSDEAFETARTLAKHFGRTTTEIVIDALREYRSRRLVPSQRITKEEAEEVRDEKKEAALSRSEETRQRRKESDGWGPTQGGR